MNENNGTHVRKIGILRFIFSTLFFLIILSVIAYYAMPYITYTARERQILSCQAEKTVAAQSSFNFIKLHSIKGGLVTFWFDDAWWSQFNIAYPMLKKYNYVGVISVQTTQVCRNDTMTWAELRELQKNGWEISSMGEDFSCSFSLLTPKEIYSQLKGSLNILNKHGLISKTFTIPCGFGLFVNKNLETQVKELFQSARELYPQINNLNYYNPYATYAFPINEATPLKQISNLLAQTKKNNGWIIFVFDRISDKTLSRGTISSEKLEKIFQMVHEQQFQIVTPQQVLDYLQTHKN